MLWIYCSPSIGCWLNVLLLLIHGFTIYTYIYIYIYDRHFGAHSECHLRQNLLSVWLMTGTVSAGLASLPCFICYTRNRQRNISACYPGGTQCCWLDTCAMVALILSGLTAATYRRCTTDSKLRTTHVRLPAIWCTTGGCALETKCLLKHRPRTSLANLELKNKCIWIVAWCYYTPPRTANILHWIQTKILHRVGIWILTL
jgi:hypothetical protein